jgi:U2 small nuclear ribonucleoprotein B''
MSLQQISFAKSRSDAVVKKIDGDNFEAHKARRDEHKSAFTSKATHTELTQSAETTRYTNPLKQKFRAKRLATESKSFLTHPSPSCSHNALVDGAAVAPAPKRPNVQMPDEYLPPNKILFLQNLPEGVTKDQLVSLFSQYVSISFR